MSFNELVQLVASDGLEVGSFAFLPLQPSSIGIESQSESDLLESERKRGGDDVSEVGESGSPLARFRCGGPTIMFA